MLRRRRWVAVLLTLSLSVMGLGLAATADSGQDNQFLSAINASRASTGLAPLAMSSSLQSYAGTHSVDMADAYKVYHSTPAQLNSVAGSGATGLGENVGRGPSVSALHAAFMDSPDHKKNILGDYNYAGIGTTTRDEYIYVTVVFMKKGATPVPAPATTTTTAGATSSSPAKPAPASTTSTTLPPTTTTTTLIVPPDQEVLPGTACLEATRFWQKCHD